MANVNIKFNGKEYVLSCEDGQEEHLEELSTHLSQKFSSLKNSLGNIGENKLLLITTIQLIDEYFDLKQKVRQQREKLDNISSKFKKIRSLAMITTLMGDFLISLKDLQYLQSIYYFSSSLINMKINLSSLKYK